MQTRKENRASCKAAPSVSTLVGYFRGQHGKGSLVSRFARLRNGRDLEWKEHNADIMREADRFWNARQSCFCERDGRRSLAAEGTNDAG